MSSGWYDSAELSLNIGETWCAGCLCTSSWWFKRIEPPRTFSNHIIAEITRRIEFFHINSCAYSTAHASAHSTAHSTVILQRRMPKE